MSGNARVEAAEFERARSELESTGQPGLVARAELTRCALRVASLVFEPCEGFERLRADSPRGRTRLCRLPGRHASPRPTWRCCRPSTAPRSGQGGAAAKGIEDPVSRLVAAGVLLRRPSHSGTGGAGGGNRVRAGLAAPLLAWLGVAAQRAEQAGAVEEAQRLRRRMALAAGEARPAQK